MRGSTIVLPFLYFLVLLIHDSSSQDYEDIDEEQFINYLLSSAKLRKCKCSAGEVLVNNDCVPSPTFIPVLLFEDILEPILVNTSTFSVIENSGLRCGSDKIVTKINPIDFFILSTGELIHVPTNSTYTPLEYCVNHVLNDRGDVAWELEMCMQPLEIPVCCPFKPHRKEELCRHPSVSVAVGFSSLKDPKIYGVTSHEIKCNEETETLTEIPVTDISNPSSPVHLSYKENVTQLVVYSELGYSSQPTLFEKDSYCIVPELQKHKIKYKASFCVKTVKEEHKMHCKNFSCVRKCCKDNEIYSLERMSCISHDQNLWKPKFHSSTNFTEVSNPEDLKLIYGFPICKRSYYALNKNDDNDIYTLLDNGHIQITKWGSEEAPPRYCIDNFKLKTNEIVENVLKCFPDDPPKKSDCVKITSSLFPALLLVSCLFLLITLIVYASVAELHAKVHGKSLLSHVTALCIAYFSLATIQWSSQKLSMTLCRTLAIVVQVSFLSAFFWLNVMCFDIWWTLRAMRPVSETRDRNKRRFVLYSIYAWGCPLIIGLTTIVMETVFRDNEDFDHLIKPGFGRRSCWFQDNLSLWIYFYSFVFVLAVANIFFFLCVAMILIQAQRANDSILRTTSTQHKERVWLYLKLFVVMGVTWICEVISWHEGTCEYWLITDIINSLQGFFMFLIFICKKNICMKLHSRGTDSTKKLRQMVQGTSSYGSSGSQVTQQTSLDSSRKFSSSFQSSLQHHLAKLNRIPTIEERPKFPK